ncbi:MAG: nucleoside permease [Flavobacterium sp.]
MSIKFRLTLLSFLQFFVWGAWLISLGGYMFTFPGDACERGALVGATYGTMGIASLFMPALLGFVADKYVNAEKLLAFCHLFCALALYWAYTTTDVNNLYWVILTVSLFYMPTIALTNTVSYHLLSNNNFEVQKVFPPIRVWGTVGFIVAMWLVDLTGWRSDHNQFLVSAVGCLVMAAFCFALPKCPPSKTSKSSSLIEILGLDAFVLFKNPKMLIFFVFAFGLGAVLQISNAFADPFLNDFGGDYKGYFAVDHPQLLISLSQISETVFILTIPFFLKRFGIKKVMLFSMIAWFLRFGLFGIGDPGSGLIFLVLSMVVYGFAFDFFNISGSLFVEKEASANMRASAQGLFMMMTNGLGSLVGGWCAGKVVSHFTENVSGNCNGVKDWSSIWFAFAVYALILAIVFAFVFKYKHNPKEMENINH